MVIGSDEVTRGVKSNHISGGQLLRHCTVYFAPGADCQDRSMSLPALAMLVILPLEAVFHDFVSATWHFIFG